MLRTTGASRRRLFGDIDSFVVSINGISPIHAAGDSIAFWENDKLIETDGTIPGAEVANSLGEIGNVYSQFP